MNEKDIKNLKQENEALRKILLLVIDSSVNQLQSVCRKLELSREYLEESEVEQTDGTEGEESESV